MNSITSIKNSLPETFSRQDVLEAGKKLGYAYSTANSFTEKALYKGLIERVGAGQYRKTA